MLIPLLFLALPNHVQAANTIIIPTSGTVGSSISISGTGFTGHLATIHWDDQIILTDVPISETGDLTCNLKVPPASKGSHTIKITDDSNWTSSTASATFTVLPQITIFPRIGRIYTPVTVIGNGFAAFERDIKVAWDGNALPASAAANYQGTWSINFNPPETTKGEHFVSAFGSVTPASEVSEVKFTVGPVAKVEPVSGPVGTEIKFEGFGFRIGEDGITITLDGDIIMCNIVARGDGSWSASLNIPPTTQGNHTIGVFGSSFTPRGIVPDTDFKVIPNIELQPKSGSKGTKITINGTGFDSNETITISFNEIKVDVVADTDDTGSFNAPLEAPQSQTKENTITASGNKGNSARAIFTAERITPPAPKLLSPEQGAKLEIFNSVGNVFLGTAKRLMMTTARPGSPRQLGMLLAIFDWSDVDSTGNAIYVLQITRGNDFSSPSLVKEELANSEYTLSADDNVTAGSYSWRVKAVDDVGNESPWSDVQRFEVIHMSNQVLIVSLIIPALIIAAIAAVIVFTWRTQRTTR